MKQNKSNFSGVLRSKADCFTLIELLVSKTCQICVSLLFLQKYLSNFATTLLRPAGYGGQDWSKIIPLFLKEKGGAGERENFFSREKKFSLSPAHSHFTLIELLVVIAIIAILAAILLPALQSARDRGKMTGCISNLKNMSQSLFRYADDFNEHGPNKTAPSGYYPGVRSGEVNAGYLIQDRVQRAGHVYQHLVCPGSQYTKYLYLDCAVGRWNNSDRLISSYGSAFGYGQRAADDSWFGWYISGAVSSINTPGVQRQLPTLRSFNRKLSYSGKTDYQSGAPSKHPMVGDLEPVPGNAISTIFTNIKSPRHHKAGVNNIFMDGHYQFSKYGTYNNSFSSTSGLARLYWSSN